ncbi:hypothetical protein NPIL_567801, partial [Nephila pilipes]
IWSPYTYTNNSEYQRSNEQSPTAKSNPVQQTTTRYGRKSGHDHCRAYPVSEQFHPVLSKSNDAYSSRIQSVDSATLRCCAEF